MFSSINEILLNIISVIVFIVLLNSMVWGLLPIAEYIDNKRKLKALEKEINHYKK